MHMNGRSIVGQIVRDGDVCRTLASSDYLKAYNTYELNRPSMPLHTLSASTLAECGGDLRIHGPGKVPLNIFAPGKGIPSQFAVVSLLTTIWYFIRVCINIVSGPTR
jgi:hypothetical protein